MPIISVAEIWDGRSASIDDAGERTYSRHFRVITDNMFTAQISVGNATGIPRRFDIYTDPDGNLDTAAFVRSIKVDQTEDPFVWLVHVEYSSKLTEPSHGAEEPLDRPAEIEWGQVKFTRPLEVDAEGLLGVAGTAIVNSAGDPFDPAPEVEECRLTLKITRNQLVFIPAVALEFTNKVNSKPWFGFAAKVAKCTHITGKRVYERGLYYWSVPYEFEFKDDTWDLKVLDQGYREFKITPPLVDPVRVRIFEAGMLVSTPSLLDGTGKRLPRNAPAVYMTYRGHDKRDFNLLQLP